MCSLWENSSSCTHTTRALALSTVCFIYKVYLKKKKKQQPLTSKKEEQRAELCSLTRGAGGPLQTRGERPPRPHLGLWGRPTQRSPQRSHSQTELKEQEINSRDAEGRKQRGNEGNVHILKE